jgi:hypothetical protein
MGENAQQYLWGLCRRSLLARPSLLSTHLHLRTRITRAVRRTIGFSKTNHLHDLVMGLFIHRYECGRAL